MEERDWLILTTLYETKNITKTAKALYISQPALTNRLQQIESEFKTRIVNRGSRGVSFTASGEHLVNYAMEMQLRLRETMEAVSNYDNRVSGTLRIGASRFIGRHKLPQMLSEFKALYPDVNFNIMSGSSGDALELLNKRSSHVSFIRGGYFWNDGKELLFRENICVASKSPFTLEDLPSLPRIAFPLDKATQMTLDSWWVGHFNAPPLVAANVDSLDTCRELVLCGLGYALMPSTIISPEDGLCVLPITDADGNPIARSNWLFYHRESLELNMVRTFVEFAKGYNYLPNA